MDNGLQDSDLHDELLGLKEKRSFEEMKLRKAIKVLSPKKQSFSWAAFFVMLMSIGTALLVGTLIPGLFDEILAAIVISAVNAFISAHRK